MYKCILKHIGSLGLFLIILFCFSCDGRDTVNKNHTQILKENGVLEQFSEKVAYIPEAYSETITDTILNTGFNIKIKTYTQMNSSYLKSEKKDSLYYKTYYRNAKADVTVTTNENIIFKDTISKAFIKKYSFNEQINLESFVLKSVWLSDHELPNSTKTDLNIVYCKPESNDCLNYTLSIDKTGHFTLKKN